MYLLYKTCQFGSMITSFEMNSRFQCHIVAVYQNNSKHAFCPWLHICPSCDYTLVSILQEITSPALRILFTKCFSYKSSRVSKRGNWDYMYFNLHLNLNMILVSYSHWWLLPLEYERSSSSVRFHLQGMNWIEEDAKRRTLFKGLGYFFCTTQNTMSTGLC